MAGRKRAAVVLDELPEGLVDEVEAGVRRAGALPLKKLTTVKLTRRADAELQEKLIRRGLERTARHVRVPLQEQLRRLVHDTALVPLAGLKSRLAGAASQSEAKQVGLGLVRGGEACLVVARGKEQLGGPTVDALRTDELAQLARLNASLADLLKHAKPKRGQPAAALLRDEVALLMGALAEFSNSLTSSRAHAPADAERAVVDAVRTLESADPLVFVPDVVHHLSDRLGVAQVHEALRAASRAGKLELRPESGIRTLSAAEASLCVPGMQGTVLSYVRRR